MTVDGMECEKGKEIWAEVSDLLLTTYARDIDLWAELRKPRLTMGQFF